MRRLHPALIVLVSLLIIPVSGEAYRLKETWQRSFAVDEGARLTLSNVNGSIDIESWGRNEIEVFAEIKIKAPSKNEARKIYEKLDFDVDASRRRVSIKADLPKIRQSRFWIFSGGDRSSITIHYTVKVPQRTDLDLGAVNGGIAALGVTGTFEVHTVNGGIELGAMRGEGEAHTTNGSVDCEIEEFPAGGDLSLKAVNGSIHLWLPEDAGGRLDAKTINGKIELEFELSDRIRVKRSSVRGVIGKGGGKIQLRTVNGNIELEEL
ncbi:MAG: DUF4097 family beta strand repeat protein [bacterium]|nr:MAG: DUF4097 family beta strand repeat protein [bacterium]